MGSPAASQWAATSAAATAGGPSASSGRSVSALGQVGVQPRPFARQEVGVDHLPEQGMPHLVAVPAGCGDQQLAGDGGPQRLD